MSESDEEAEDDHFGSDTERNRVKVFSVSTLPWRSNACYEQSHVIIVMYRFKHKVLFCLYN